MEIRQLNMSPVGKCTRWTAPVDFYYPKAASSMLQEELVASTKSIFKSTMNIPYTSSVLFLFTARAEQRFRRVWLTPVNYQARLNGPTLLYSSSNLLVGYGHLARISAREYA